MQQRCESVVCDIGSGQKLWRRAEQNTTAVSTEHECSSDMMRPSLPAHWPGLHVQKHLTLRNRSALDSDEAESLPSLRMFRSGFLTQEGHTNNKLWSWKLLSVQKILNAEVYLIFISPVFKIWNQILYKWPPPFSNVVANFKTSNGKFTGLWTFRITQIKWLNFFSCCFLIIVVYPFNR